MHGKKEVGSLIARLRQEKGIPSQKALADIADVRLEGISEQIPDIDLFIAMYVRKEAILSSQIEGTQATLDDILDPDIDNNTNLDVAQVINYIKATQLALLRMDELPLCNRLLKETHQVLLEGIRGQERNPGEFRRTQNWIGPPGGSLKNAAYVPPALEAMEKAISEWEKFINAEDDMDPLIKYRHKKAGVPAPASSIFLPPRHIFYFIAIELF